MKTATTLDFRYAVRDAAAVFNVSLSPTTWTDRSENSKDKRYVAFRVRGFNPNTIATAAERILNARNLTAKTRATQDFYIRGTCISA